MTNRPRRPLLAWVLLLLAPAATAGAQSWDPFPLLLKGEHVAVAPGLDGPAYDALRGCLRDFDSEVGAEYFAAVVGVTAADGSTGPRPDAVDYVDALYDAWRFSGRLDPDTHVLMVLGTRNRAVAVHPGSRWANLGFEGGAIASTIDGSSFATHARGGDYGRALCALAEAVDDRLAALAGAGRGLSGTPPSTSAPPAPRAAERSSGCGLGALLLLALLAGGAFFAYRGLRGRRAREAARAELASWRAKLELAAARLLELEKEHPLYFALSGAERWRGESRALDQAAADAVNHAFLLYSKASELRRDAAALVDDAGWRSEPHAEALALLRDSEVRIETGEAETERRIFLPLEREYRGTASELLADLDRAYGDAAARLAEAETAVERALAAATETAEAAAAALAAAERRGELGLPVEQTTAALDPLFERRTAADARINTDPVAAARELAELAAELRERGARIAEGNRVVETLRGPVRDLGRTLRAEVERLRQAGYALAEPGFEPDLRLDHGVREAARIETRVAAGEEPGAAAELAALERGLEDLRHQLAAAETARDGVPGRLAELEDRAAALRRRLPETETVLRRLEAEHAPESFRAEADNLDELRTLLERLGERFEAARVAHGEERYLSALEDLENAGRLVAEGFALVDAVGAIERALAEARRASRELARRAGALLEDLERRAGERAPLGPRLRRSVQELGERTRALAAAAGEPRAAWLELEAELEGATAELERLGEQVDAELRARETARELERTLASGLAELEREVAAETRDRPHVEREVADAARGLRDWRSALESGAASGTELERQGRDVAAALERARRAFDTEMDQVRLAESRLEAAEAALRRLDGRGFGYGVVAELGAVRELRRAAEEARRNRDWDRVLDHAQRIASQVEAETRRAEEEARMLQEEARRRLAARRAAERRRTMRHAAAGAGTLARTIGGALAEGAFTGGALGSSRTSFGTRSRVGRPRGRSGGGGRSGGSSFGGSRSGGSGW